MRIEGMLPQQLQILAKTTLESLHIGDLIQGRVASIKDGILLMKLLDGSSFTASLSGDVDIPEGTFLTLQIGEPIGDQLTARIVSREPQSGKPEGDSSLATRVGEQLKAYGGKAAGEFISKVIDLIGADPSLDIGKASFLVANRMDEHPGMREMILKLAQNEFQLDTNLTVLKDSIIEALPKIEDSALEALLRPLLGNSGMDNAISDLADKIIQSLAQAQPENGAAHLSAPPSERPNLVADLAGRLAEALTNANLPSEMPDSAAIMSMVKEALAALNIVRNTSSEQPTIPDDVLRDAVSEFISSMSELHKDAGMAQKPEPAIIRKAVEELFEKAYIKAEGGVSEPVDIGEKVKALKNVLTFTDEAMKLVDSKSAQTMLPVVRELQNALQFFNRTDTYHVFVQIPFMINNHKTTGELYVMKRKSKRGRIDPNQFTFFMSLSTQNLGLVEAFLNASNRCITISFRVEDEALVDFFRSHRKMLHEALGEMGYTLAEMKCRLLSENRANLLDAMQQAEEALGMNARIDLKI